MSRGTGFSCGADLNVPLKDGVITDTTRIRETMPPSPPLERRSVGGALLAPGPAQGHRLRGGIQPGPGGRLAEDQGLDLRLASGVTGPAVAAEAAALRPGQVLLLENLRFEKGETKNDPDFAKALARLADTYVDDAFGSSHRAHASVSGMVPDFAPGRAVAGFLMEKELTALGKVMTTPSGPCWPSWAAPRCRTRSASSGTSSARPTPS